MDALRDEMARAVAHEIKNPVALAMANVALIRLTDDLDEMSGYCDRIERALMSINTLAQRLLCPEDAESRAFDIAVLLETLTDEYRAAWPGITFYTGLPSHPLAFEGDEARIRMVFTNLLKNAVEAAGPNGRVEVLAEAADSEVTVCIRDSGSGLNEEAMSRIPSGRYSTKPGGSGIGLMICRSLVEGFGGRFGLHNKEGGSGCEAVVVLPVYKSPGK